MVQNQGRIKVNSQWASQLECEMIPFLLLNCIFVTAEAPDEEGCSGIEMTDTLRSEIKYNSVKKIKIIIFLAF